LAGGGAKRPEEGEIPGNGPTADGDGGEKAPRNIALHYIVFNCMILYPNP
tara:strand:+ start:8423 stop:8572 length:150 start_codon:yes stop_codon:yes gene_type:complete